MLLLVVPVYGLVFRNTSKRQLARYVTGFFLAVPLMFYLLGRAGVNIGFPQSIVLKINGIASNKNTLQCNIKKLQINAKRVYQYTLSISFHALFWATKVRY